MKFKPSFILVCIVILFLVLRCMKQKEHFASTSGGTLLQLRAKGFQDDTLTTNHNYFDFSRGYRRRGYPRNAPGNYRLNTHVGYPGHNFYPLNYNVVNSKEPYP